ncbi:hypothetical protein [Guptibacillus spartinae]|uniref:hypothetical protein n=1 Tax=Guptibacillus spartinae TaxID=3025679 RepID=UPI0023608CD7|nr:hypothetical protein [Pseudalkalibacillus spartinae]
MHFPALFYCKIQENGFQRLPNTTGSNSKDPKRQNPEKNAIKYQITEQHLEELLDVLIAEYNAAPHGGLNYLSPLETLEQRIQKGELIRTMDENMREDFAILTIQASRIVRGKFKSGVSPHINYEGVVYRSDVLVKSPDLIGTKLDLLVNTEDLRAVKAFLPDGSELGLLQATGKWFYTKHSLRTRKTINSLRSRKLIHFTNADDPILIYYKYLEEEVSKGKKASGNKLIELRREIEDKTAEYISRERMDGEREHIELTNNDNISKKDQNIKSKPFNKTISY